MYVCMCLSSGYPVTVSVPVSCTEEAFVFQRQPVETGGRWREEEEKSSYKGGTRQWATCTEEEVDNNSNNNKKSLFM